jgi:hypothetical protein
MGHRVTLGTITLSVLAAIDFLVFLVIENRKRVQGRYDYLLFLPADGFAELGDDRPSFLFSY